jgi:phage terminase large subunit-like protein
MNTREIEFAGDVLSDFGIVESDTHQNGDIAWLPDDPIAWIEQEFWIPETGAALKLEPYQKAVLTQALTRDGEDFRYSLVLWSDLKKSAKSTIAAAVVLWLAWHHSWETCRVVGNDLKQAASRTFYYIERAIKLNKKFSSHVKTRTNHILLDNNTSIDAIPVDPSGEAGGGDLIVCFTELWAAKNAAAKQLWTETTLSPLKYGKSLRWCESYAGFDGQSPILEQLYESGVKNGASISIALDDHKPPLELYENQAARFLCLWNTIPRCDWQTDSYYAQEAAALAPEEFNRVHRNQWATSTNKFIAMEWWDACEGDVPPLGAYEPLVLGIDAAVTHDSFAVVGVSRRGDIVYPRYVKVWTPPKGGKIDFSEPEAELRRLAKEHTVAVMTYDPMQLEDMMQRFVREGVAYCQAFPQGAPRLEADTALYQRIMTRRIRHDGDPTLREHLQNSDADIDNEAHKMRIVHRAPQVFMDATVALSQACAIAAEWNVG